MVFHVLAESLAPTHITWLRPVFEEAVGKTTSLMLGLGSSPGSHDLLTPFEMLLMIVA